MNTWRVQFEADSREIRASDGKDKQTVAGFKDEKEREALRGRFAGWADAYAEAIAKPDAHAALLAIGREMADWLNAGTGWVRRWRGPVEPPLVIEFEIPSPKADDLAAAFLDAPWELLADPEGFWALDEDTTYCPVRRIGAAREPLPPSPYRLMVMFMAAAPRGQDELRYEAEEAAIVRATRDIGLDLIVEDTGTLAELGGRVTLFQPVDVVHLSCHGKLKPEPRLQLEDRFGDPDLVTASQLARELSGVKRPRLLFLSACETAMAHEVIGSAARTLVRKSAPAVLGWGASVRDDQATTFAAALYRSLVDKQHLEHAVGLARLQLNDEVVRQHSPTDRRNDWHMARLFLGPTGGGVPAEGRTTRVRLGSATKEFLDAKGNRKVAVAGELEFVGRRRQLQTVLREFHLPTRHGVLLHGMGRLGKSSLAARVAHRMPRHELVVVYERYSLPDIVQAIRTQSDNPGVPACIKEHDSEPGQALRAVLGGPCSQHREEQGRTTGRPLLVVLDDFEQVLVPQRNGLHTVKPNLVPDIRGLLEAFVHTPSESRLLITSRFQFTLPDEGGRDLAAHLFDCSLPAMSETGRRRQVEAKRPVLVEEQEESAKQGRAMTLVDEDPARTERVIQAGLGNPGLQDVLYRMSRVEPEACDRCLDRMEAYLAGKERADEERLREFFETLALDKLLELLSGNEQAVLRAASMFSLPIPRSELSKLAAAAAAGGEQVLDRLVALGMLEVHEDVYDPRVNSPALMLSRLIGPRLDALSEEDADGLAHALGDSLYQSWGGAAGRNRRGYALDIELALLALRTGDTDVLGVVATDAVRHLFNTNQPQQAAALGQGALGCFAAPPPPTRPPSKTHGRGAGRDGRGQIRGRAARPGGAPSRP